MIPASKIPSLKAQNETRPRIVQAIKSWGGIASRREIAAITNIPFSTLFYFLKPEVDRGLIHECEIPIKKAGRRTIYYQLTDRAEFLENAPIVCREG